MEKLLFVVLASFLFAGVSDAGEQKWDINPAPKSLPKVVMLEGFEEKVDTGWEGILNAALKGFTDDYFWHTKDSMTFKARAIRQMSHTLISERGFGHIYYWEIFKSPKTLEAIYHWAIPSVKQAFRLFPEKDQKEYLTLFRHCEAYANSFDYDWEKAYDKVCSKSTVCDFARTHPTDKSKNKLRPLEAFIYRRVKNGMTIKDVNKWIGRIVSDLEEARQETYNESYATLVKRVKGDWHNLDPSIRKLIKKSNPKEYANMPD